MKAAILKKPKVIKIEDIPKPKPKTNEVLIKIKEVGLCGSDVHYYNNGRIGNFVLRKPIILGHESAGIVEEVGEDVKNLKAGDRVTIEPGVPCKRCNYCREGNYNLCSDIRFMATPPDDGAFIEYLTYDSDFVYKIPDNTSLTSGALIEPLSVGYSACTRANIAPGDIILILGSGPIGLATLEVAKIFGPSRIYIADINDYRLNVAKKNGAYETINILKQDIFKILKKIQIDLVIEASGVQESIINSVKIVKRGGKVIWIGMGNDSIPIPYPIVISKDLTVEGIFRYKNTYSPIIKLLKDSKINIEYLVSHHFKFKDILKAFKLSSRPNFNKLKIVIDI